MAEKTDYEVSMDNWVKEQENLISTFELNIEYLENEISLKQQALSLNIHSLAHEKQVLEKHLNKK